jgi:ribosomal protein S14
MAEKSTIAKNERREPVVAHRGELPGVSKASW